MSRNAIQRGCSEKYEELCAVSTTGELSPEEWTDLREHLAACSRCSELLNEYTNLAEIGMAKLGPIVQPDEEASNRFAEKRAELRLTSSLRAKPSEEPQELVSNFPALGRRQGQGKARTAAMLAAIAAVLLVSVVSAYKAGEGDRTRPTLPQQSKQVPIAPLPPDTEKAQLKLELAAVEKSLNEITTRAAEAEKRAAELDHARASLEGQLQNLAQQNATASTTLTNLTAERDGLKQQLSDASNSLDRVNTELNQARQDRQGALLRIASLENDVNRLNASLTVSGTEASTNEKYLAQDRDIRELMGARQLYIADVFDVQHNGEKSKAFGRVFYTKGKSLVFYAFDLEVQPGYREAKAFQAWGRPDTSSAKPISLGIFYMDSESNRRWVLKTDNPDALAQINAVFVTVEPKGGSAKPTGKPFLEAYLHSLPPNHP
jgi:sugar-specific transcriptional regulator TrmB